MKKHLTILALVTLLCVSIFPTSVSAVKRPKKTPELSWNSIKQFTAKIIQVNEAENFVMIQEGKKSRKVITSGALISKITQEGAQTMTLSGIVKDQETHFWVKKAMGPKSSYQGLLITQVLGNKLLAKQDPVLQFAAVSSQGSESLQTPSILVALSKVAAKEVKFEYTVSGTATGVGTDYTLANGNATIPVGQTVVTIPLAVSNDTAQEVDETVIVTLASPTNASLGANKTHVYTIQDNDQPGVSFAVATANGSESVTSVPIQVVLSTVSTLAVSVSYTVSGTATGSGVDYSLANGTITIPPGQTSATFNAAIVDDSLIESGEMIIVTLASPVGTTLGAIATHIYTINDNDAPTVNFSSVGSTNTEETTAINIPVTLSAVSPKETKVNYAVTGGTATANGTDFTLASGTLTIPIGQSSANITATVVNDTVDELDETIIITLSNPVDVVLGTVLTHTYTIQDNDNPTVQFQSGTGSGLETVTPVSIPVTVSAAPAADVQVAYAVTGTATGSGADYTLANGTLTIPAGQLSANISLVVVNDGAPDPGETVIITLSGPANATLGTTTTYTYTITE